MTMSKPTAELISPWPSPKADYLAPEQIQNMVACKESDQYALGAITYEWLSGALPFDGNSGVEIALKHL